MRPPGRPARHRLCGSSSLHLEAAPEAPVLGPYEALIDQLPAERLPRKQLYTARKIYETIKAEGLGL